MNNQYEIDLVVKRGLIVFDTVNLTEIPECDLDFCDSVSTEIGEVCNQIEWGSDHRVFLRKPDGTVCYCRCR